MNDGKSGRVIILTREYPPYIYGGAGVHVDYLTRSLQKLMGVEVRCFGDQQQESSGITVRGYQPWKLLSINSDKRFCKVLKPFSVDLAMAKDPCKADVIHAHTWYTFMAGFLAGQLYGLPLVTTIHSMEPLRPWKKEQLGRGYHLSSWMEKTGLEASDRVIAVSREMKEDILRYFNIEEDRVEVIYNGIDLQEYSFTESTSYRRKYGIDLDQPYILFVGRISRQKGIIHLVNAIDYLQPGVQVVLCAGAPDTEELAREMADRVNTLQQSRKGVIWIEEMVSRQAVIEFYSHASVFVCPSVYEPFGIINLEAMACRTPVVAAASGGIKEVVVDGETGFLVDFDRQEGSRGEPADPTAYSRALADRINHLLSDPELQREFGINGRQRVEEHFSWDSIARQTRELYLKLV